MSHFRSVGTALTLSALDAQSIESSKVAKGRFSKAMHKFFISVGLILPVLLAACGGGGGGGSSASVVDPNSPVVNPTVRTIDRINSGFSFPTIPNTKGYVTVMGNSIYVSDASKVWVLNFLGQSTTSISVPDPRGVVGINGSLYYASWTASSTDQFIYIYPNTVTSVASSGVASTNFGSLASFSGDLYAVDYSNSGQILKFTNNIGTGASVTGTTGANYITSDSNRIYITKTAGVGYIDQQGVHAYSWGLTNNPQGIAVTSNYAYVVSDADMNGNGAVIKRVKLSDGTVDTYVDEQSLGVWDHSISKGFCGPTGMAVNTTDGYLYVINGYCTGSAAGNAHSLLRIKI